MSQSQSQSQGQSQGEAMSLWSGRVRSELTCPPASEHLSWSDGNKAPKQASMKAWKQQRSSSVSRVPSPYQTILLQLLPSTYLLRP